MLKRFLVILALTLAANATARAYIGPWSEGHGYTARLLIGGMRSGGYYRGGVEVRMAEGWKTYWRMPGDNGIPPVFNTDNSKNLKGMDLFWPTPIVFPDGDGMGIGYKNTVIFPFKIYPQSIEETVDFNLALFFGVCAEICVPASENFVLPLMPGKNDGQGFVETLLNGAFKSVPTPPTRFDTRAKHVVYSQHAENESVTILIDIPSQNDDPSSMYTLLVEGPVGWYFPPRTIMVEQRDDRRNYPVTIPLQRTVKTPLSENQSLRLTIISGNKAVDQSVVLE